MRAGLLSDPRVVALLLHEFVPCLSSALNTPDLIGDPRDVDLLAGYARAGRERFVGGEREAFLLPDGTMMDVFMSLHGPDGVSGPKAHGTAAARRSAAATALFRRHGEAALLRCGGLPEEWGAYWDGTAEAVKAVQQQGPQWPRPRGQALRVFVRNGHPAYDDLHGVELLALDGRRLLVGELAKAGDRAEVTREVFFDLVRAMVPRGDVDTRLKDESITGELVLVAERGEGDLVSGRLEGTFAMAPKERAEVGRRANAAGMFAAHGRLLGRFTWNRSNGCLGSLRAAAVDTEHRTLLPWDELHGLVLDYAVAIEWVVGEGAR